MTESIVKKLKTDDDREERTVSSDGIINTLPDECLLSIFCLLPAQDLLHLRKVCFRWEAVVTQAWKYVKKLNLDLLNTNDTTYTDILSECGDFLEELHFTYYSSDRRFNLERHLPVPMDVIKKYCRNLKKLSILFESKCTTAEGKELTEFLEQNDGLQCIELRNLRYVVAAVRGRLIAALPRGLTRIALYKSPSEDNYHHRSALPLQVLSKFHDLKYLVLNSFQIAKSEYKAFQNLRQLTHLKLCQNLHYDTIDFSRLHNLEVLDLWQQFKIWPGVIDDLVKNCQNLKHLGLKYCTILKAESLVGLSTLPNFQSLTVDQCTGENIGTTIKQLYNLQEFTYIPHYRAQPIQDSAFISLIEVATNLRMINLSQMSISYWLLDAANQIINARTDATKLLIIVPNDVSDKWAQRKTVSPKLIVKTLTQYLNC